MHQSYRIGDLDVLAFSDGLLKTSIDLVRDFPREEAGRLTHADPSGLLFIPVNNYVFRRPGATILVDAGAADSMQPTLGRLPAALAAGGIAPGDVTHILLTHLHPDHANGLIDREGQAVFPEAEILVAAQEYDFWMAEEGANDGDLVRRFRARNRLNMAPYAQRTWRLREGDAVLGCTPLLAPGHSPGHTCWRIDTGGTPLMAWGDLVHLAGVQIAHPTAALTYDLDQDMAKRSRMRFLDMAAVEGLAIAGAHVDAPGLGRVLRQGASYAFAALDGDGV